MAQHLQAGGPGTGQWAFPLVAHMDRFAVVSRASVNPYKADNIGIAWHLVQTRWGRTLLHLAAALRAGHWRWHLAGIIRELREPRVRDARQASLWHGRHGAGC
jgi:hypothetical protein